MPSRALGKLCGAGLVMGLAFAAVVAALQVVGEGTGQAAVAPRPPPLLPPGADPYNPPFALEGGSGPAIGDGLRTAGPGETVTLAGSDFAAGTVFEVFSQARGRAGAVVRLAPDYVGPAAATLALPSSLPVGAMHLLRARSAKGYGPAFAINRTETWWLGPDAAAAGERFAVYGRNLSDPDGSRAAIYLKTAANDGRFLPIVTANPYRVEVRTPALPPGSYEVWAHNGRGGRLGWSGPLTLKIRAAPVWSKHARTVVDVADFGARGDGASDDGAAIEAALDAAERAAPSTLRFGRGVYLSRRSFRAPSGVRWLGVGRDATALRLAARLDAQGFLYAGGDVRDVAFEALTIDADRRVSAQDRALIALGGARIRIADSRLNSWGGETLRITARALVIDRNEITGAGSFLGVSEQVFATGNVFRMTSDAEAAVTSWGGRGLALIGNLLVNADPSRADGSGIGRLFVAQGHFGSVRDAYFSGNETRNAAPRDCAAVDCNKGEQIIFEFGGVALLGRASALSPTTVTIPRLSPAPGATRGDVVIAAGRGAGQRRRVLSIEGHVVTFDRPWTVQPDRTSSQFYVTPVAERAVVYRNRFQGRKTYAAHDSNSTAVLVWGLCFDMVVADNDISRMRHGVMAAATSGTPQDSVSAPFFTLVEGNRIRAVNNGIYTGLTFGYDSHPDVLGGVGNVFRRNDIRDVAHIGLATDLWDSRGGDVIAPVFERNRVLGAPYGMVTGLKLIWAGRLFRSVPSGRGRLLGAGLRGNVFVRGPLLSPGSIGYWAGRGVLWSTRGDRWSGFRAGNGPAP
ncbi:glycosyl hydrolase family 28-related protein [Methylopila sp. Yamaguchi]|uniref:glycosyl hydrolase family 28-related protein n=1 Tax=Methylopila sp. Yamaguchi TaxID=1437817 RepID=UPI000CA7965C|nr:glycosyl hydrolase family 28-related protein [Methylopila sp. Yamaguchi]GBD48063.1 polygalacturonase [Methylopila sp. Yamaguchi]